MLADILGHRRYGLFRNKGLALQIDKNRNRKPPATLAADAPVRAGFEHAGDTFFAPAGNPRHVLHALQRQVSQVFTNAGQFAVHTDEPLLGRPEYDRPFATPAVGIAVRNLALCVQQPDFFEMVVNNGIDFQDFQPFEPAGHGIIVSAVVQNRRINSKVVFLPGKIILDAVTRSDMHKSGAVFGSDIFGENHNVGVLVRRIFLNKRMHISQSIKLAASDRLFTDAVLSLAQAAGGHHRLDAFGCQNRDIFLPVLLVADCLIIQVRMHRHRQIRRQGPRRGRPDHKTDLCFLGVTGLDKAELDQLADALLCERVIH